jgi:hypothetical protein
LSEEDLKMHRRLLPGLLALAVAASVTRAQPAETKPSPDSPKAALREQEAAAKAGNLDADLSLYAAEDQPRKKLARAIATEDLAVAKVEKSVADRFGKELAAATVRASGNEDAQAIEASTENVEGDHATVRFSNAPAPVPMIRAEGKWKVSLSEWTPGTSDEDLGRLTSKISELAAQLDHIADLVSRGKFRSGEGVRDRVQTIHDQAFSAATR